MGTELEWAWASGLFEGEGNIYITPQGYPKIGLAMTDEDVVRRFAALTDSKVYGPYLKENRKPVWTVRIQDREKIKRILILMLPYFGDRRRVQALDAVDAATNIKPKEYPRPLISKEIKNEIMQNINLSSSELYARYGTSITTINRLKRKVQNGAPTLN